MEARRASRTEDPPQAVAVAAMAGLPMETNQRSCFSREIRACSLRGAEGSASSATHHRNWRARRPARTTARSKFDRAQWDPRERPDGYGQARRWLFRPPAGLGQCVSEVGPQPLTSRSQVEDAQTSEIGHADEQVVLQMLSNSRYIRPLTPQTGFSFRPFEAAACRR